MWTGGRPAHNPPCFIAVASHNKILCTVSTVLFACCLIYNIIWKEGQGDWRKGQKEQQPSLWLGGKRWNKRERPLQLLLLFKLCGWSHFSLVLQRSTAEINSAVHLFSTLCQKQVTARRRRNIVNCLIKCETAVEEWSTWSRTVSLKSIADQQRGLWNSPSMLLFSPYLIPQ